MISQLVLLNTGGIKAISGSHSPIISIGENDAQITISAVLTIQTERPFEGL